MEDVFHFFVQCPRVAAAWEFLAFRAARSLGGLPQPDRLLLMLAWPPFPPSAADVSVALAVVVYMGLAWSSRDLPGDLDPGAVREAVGVAAAGAGDGAVWSIFPG